MTTQELLKVDLESLHQLLITHSSVDAAALYGSVARGDIERHSDVDLLLVCRASRKLPAFLDISKVLDGCFHRLSLTVYSERELKFLHSASSLFLLHLSREAVLLFDRNDFLKPLLADFQPKKSYSQDFQKSLSLMDPLRIVIQGAPNNLHRLSYIYSLFRVFGVYLLAENGIYEFSKSRMVRLLVDRFPDQKESVELLSTLRALNSNFFTGGLAARDEDEARKSVLQQTNALASLSRVEMDVVPMPYEKAVHSFDEALGERDRALDYRLRMWFLLLVYDGLNLYCSKVGSKPLTSFSEPALRGLVDSESPEPVCCAVGETISYLHRYPLKYFLSEESKINARNARAILHGISDELARG
ncbi:MAG: nucleotidyltransferase domain-containing protein [Candidatus Acidiferrales bacterium]